MFFMQWIPSWNNSTLQAFFANAAWRGEIGNYPIVGAQATAYTPARDEWAGRDNRWTSCSP
jgi:hypothetical protein